MSRAAEATFWQAVGAAVGIAAGIAMVYDCNHYGLAPIQPRALALGLGASFLLLAGGACYLGGRALRVGETRLTPIEAALWKTLAAVCLIAGGAVVYMAWRQHGNLLLDRLTMALGGAFSMTFGVLCLLGERVMSHMHDALLEEKAKTAVSGQ